MSSPAECELSHVFVVYSIHVIFCFDPFSGRSYYVHIKMHIDMEWTAPMLSDDDDDFVCYRVFYFSVLTNTFNMVFYFFPRIYRAHSGRGDLQDSLFFVISKLKWYMAHTDTRMCNCKWRSRMFIHRRPFPIVGIHTHSILCCRI